MHGKGLHASPVQLSGKPAVLQQPHVGPPLVPHPVPAIINSAVTPSHMCKRAFLRHWKMKVTIILTISFWECWEETKVFQVWGKVFVWRAALPLQQSLDSSMLGDSQETLIEQTLPVKNYTLLGASRDIYSQVCLNGRNSWAAASVLQTAPKKKSRQPLWWSRKSSTVAFHAALVSPWHWWQPFHKYPRHLTERTRHEYVMAWAQKKPE